MADTPRSDVGIIMLVPSGWGDVWTGRHQLAARLSRSFPLVWVTPPQRWRRAFRAAPTPRFVPAEHAPGVDVYTPPRSLPHVHRPRALQDFLFRRRLRQAAARLRARGVRSIVLYVWRPGFSRALGLLDHQLSIYHINDEYSFADEEQQISAEERALIGKVDEVIIHSPELMRRKGSINPRTTLIPNGVDFAAFSTPVDVPPEFAPIPRPRVGYVGWLKRHLDWVLLERLILDHPGCSFVFVGPQSPHPELDATLARLRARPNVWFLGRQPAVRLPAYVQQLDVCLLPYVNNAYTRCIYPLKVHEYLAAGRPVVGTSLPSLEPLGDVLHLVTRHDEWPGALAAALSDEAASAAWRDRRQAVARAHDWDVLAARITTLICQRLSRQSEGRVSETSSVHAAGC